MKPEIAYCEMAEGVVALVSAGQARFSFRIGKRRPDSFIEPPGAHLWFVQEGGRHHMVQMVLSEVPQQAMKSNVSHYDILLSHLKWETDFQQERLQRKMVDSGMGYFPTREPFLIWGMEGPIEDVPGDAEKATSYSANATTFHDGVIVLFGIQGYGSGWDPKLIQLKCWRVMLSMFRHSSVLNLPFTRSAS